MTRLLPILAIAAIALAACVPETGLATPSATASAPAESAPSATAAAPPSASPEPPPSPSTTASETASASPPSSPEAGASSDAPGGAAACSGSDGNRDFFADAATDLDWPVYCAVLPKGWFVGAGEYRLGNGGYLQITYEGPGNAQFALQEGAVCGAVNDCPPAGEGIGEAAFADRTGTLVDVGTGDLAIVVGTGEGIIWVASGSGLDESLFRELAAAVVEVSG